MARQPILDREGRVHAYELLYRRSASAGAGPMDAADEHRSILNAMVEVGLGRLAGDKPAFFNLSPEMLMGVCTSLLPPDRVVLELLENTVLDAPVARRMNDLRREGYRLAYDDFTFQPHQIAFVGRVDLIKIDVMDTPWGLIEHAMPQLRKTGTRLLAEKVEDREVHKRCLRAGFDLFQGYYFSRPETLVAQGIDARRRAVLNLLSALNRPNASAVQIETALGGDPALAARLLKLVNRAGFGVARKVDSIRVAIGLLGIPRLQAFATVLAAANATGGDNRTLSDLGLVRARLCERVAVQLGREDPNKAFTIGLLSVLDALMNLPMATIVEELALSDDVAVALLQPEGCIELRVATAYERGGWSDLRGLRLDENDLNRTYAEAVAATAETE